MPQPARRRGRPPVIATERVLSIAREVFLERGIRATTSEVALRAGISEGTLFHRFATKDALFRAAMNFDPMVEPPVIATLPKIAGQGDLRANLVDLGMRMLELGGVALPVMMMAWSNPASEYSLEKLAARNVNRPKVILQALRAFFATEREHGRLGEHADPDMLARAFMGSLHHHCLQEILFRDDPQRPSREKYVRGIVDLLLDGAGVGRKRGAKDVR
ncbi:MAG: TetR/AcrR family transcriptional regulator [Labilithrix sp.]|nr:TetR/AcrR family transcriptional regulator [Labilithrix sp.]